MKQGLTVVTHTCPSSGRDITRCVDSVKAALPENSEHIIIENAVGTEMLIQYRHDAMKYNDIVVFVDDDDYISKDSLSYCLEALEKTDAGIAYTNEIIVNANGEQQRSKHAMQYEFICNNPSSIHHMTAFNTKYINERSLLLSQKYKCAIEWCMKVDAILTSGSAIFIPIDGYYWVQHPNQLHRNPIYQQPHKENTSLTKNEMIQWGKLSGLIPHWDITSK